MRLPKIAKRIWSGVTGRSRAHWWCEEACPVDEQGLPVWPAPGLSIDHVGYTEHYIAAVRKGVPGALDGFSAFLVDAGVVHDGFGRHAADAAMVYADRCRDAEMSAGQVAREALMWVSAARL